MRDLDKYHAPLGRMQYDHYVGADDLSDDDEDQGERDEDEQEIDDDDMQGDITPPAAPLVGIELNPGPTAEKATTSVAVTASSWSSTSDILGTIFSFLSFREMMSSCITVNHVWLNRGHTMPSRRVAWPNADVVKSTAHRPLGDFELPLFRRLLTSTSSFLYHIGSLRLGIYFTGKTALDQWDQRAREWFVIYSSSLRSPSSPLPNLTELSFNLSFSDEKNSSQWFSSSVFPQQLTKLYMTMHFDEIRSSCVGAVMSQFSADLKANCQQLTFLMVALTLSRLRDPEDEAEDTEEVIVPVRVFRDLRDLPLLNTFDFFTQGSHLLSEEHFAVLRSFPSLTHLTCWRPDWSQMSQVEILEAIMPLPVASSSNDGEQQLQLRRTPFAESLDISMSTAPVLARYRWLEELDAIIRVSNESDSINQVNFLIQLTQLRRLNLSLVPDIAIESALTSFCKMNHMQKLRLNEMRMTSEQLARVVPSMLLLSELTLQGISQLESLHFLAALPSPSRLLSLTILQLSKSTQSQVPASDVQYIYQLSRLEQLYLQGVFATELNEATMDSFDRQSASFDHARLPYLESAMIIFIPPASPLVGIELNPGPQTDIPKIDSSSSSSSSRSIAVESSSWTQQRDVLQSIFRFLKFKEVIRSVIFVSHNWYSTAAASADQPPNSYRLSWPPSRMSFSSCFKSTHAALVSSSPFLHHITAFDAHKLSDTITLPLVANILTHLKSLPRLDTMRINVDALNDQKREQNQQQEHQKEEQHNSTELPSWPRHLLPARLRTLEFAFMLKDEDDETVYRLSTQLVADLAANAPHLKSLSLIVRFIQEDMDARIRMPHEMIQHLARLPHLHTFKYLPFNNTRRIEDFDARHYELLSSFPSLTYFDWRDVGIEDEYPHWIVSTLAKLAHLPLRQLPHARDVRIDGSEQMAHILGQYRHLERFECRFSTNLARDPATRKFRVSFLINMENLRDLTVNLSGYFDDEVLIEAVRHLTRLTRLCLSSCGLPESSQFVRMLAPLHQLTDLELTVTSTLAFLECVPARTLTRLDISANVTDERVDPSEIHYIYPFSCLESLSLWGLFRPSLAKEVIESFTNRESSLFDHARFPYLRKCNIEDDEEEEAEEDKAEDKEDGAGLSSSAEDVVKL